jgi:8-oxo-dGTP pyrophosphatase MutT (NUDIX family)
VSDPFQVVSTARLLHSSVFDVERRTIKGEGVVFDRDVVTHMGAVAVVAIDDQGRAGLIRQYRAPIDALNMEIPAGTLDVEGEAPLDAAKRELLEELGCAARQWTLLGRFLVSPGWTNQVMSVYEARDLTVFERAPAGPEEVSASIHWLTASDVAALLRSNVVLDITSALALRRVFGNVIDRV